jgi:hypothetical protein
MSFEVPEHFTCALCKNKTRYYEISRCYRNVTKEGVSLKIGDRLCRKCYAVSSDGFTAMVEG